MKINLLPLEYRPQPAVKMKRLLILAGSSSMVFLSLLFAGLQFFMFSSTKTELTILEKDLVRTEAPLKRVAVVEERYQHFQKRQTEVVRITNQYQTHLQLLSEISLALSEDLWLNAVKVANDGKINIEGSSLEFSFIGDYLGRLGREESFGNAKLKEVNEIEENGLSYYKFNIDLLSKGGAPENAPKPKV